MAHLSSLPSTSSGRNPLTLAPCRCQMLASRPTSLRQLVQTHICSPQSEFGPCELLGGAAIYRGADMTSS